MSRKGWRFESSQDHQSLAHFLWHSLPQFTSVYFLLEREISNVYAGFRRFSVVFAKVLLGREDQQPFLGSDMSALPTEIGDRKRMRNKKEMQRVTQKRPWYS